MFRRALNNWEIEDVARLLKVLNTPPAMSQRKDKPVWKLYGKKGMLGVLKDKMISFQKIKMKSSSFLFFLV